jgi:nucleoside-diphosphate-sugar epimerase
LARYFKYKTADALSRDAEARGLDIRLDPDLRPLPLPVAHAAALLMEAGARITGREPLLTRYSVAILARTQTYDISAARRDLGYAPVVSLEEGIRRTLAALETRRG